MSDNETPAQHTPAHTRTLSSSHTRKLSSAHALPATHAIQTTDIENGAHTQQLTSVPPELPQLMVTTPTTAYSAYTSQSTPSSFESSSAPFSPPAHVPDVPVPAIPEEYRTQPRIEATDEQFALAKPVLPSVVVTNPTPPPHKPAFASPGMANPNAPVLPKISTPASAAGARKAVPPPVVVTPPPVERVRAPGKTYSPPGKTSPPSAGAKSFSGIRQTPFAAGSMSTMSPVAAARSFNARQPQPQPLHGRNGSGEQAVGSPTVATAQMYVQTLLQANNAVRGTGAGTTDRIIGKETLFDLDVDEDPQGAHEIPIEDVLAEELPEYIQVYLTPHPDREPGSLGEKDKATILGEKEKELTVKDKEALEYERRAAKWSDVEATLPAYKSTASLSRSGTNSSGGSSAEAAPKKQPLARRILPRKFSTRVVCIVLVLIFALVVPIVAFGVVFGVQAKNKHESGTATQPVSSSADSSQPIAAQSSTGTQPIVAPMTTGGPSRMMRRAPMPMPLRFAQSVKGSDHVKARDPLRFAKVEKGAEHVRAREPEPEPYKVPERVMARLAAQKRTPSKIRLGKAMGDKAKSAGA